MKQRHTAITGQYPIRCRPSGENWVLVGLLVFCGVGFCLLPWLPSETPSAPPRSGADDFLLAVLVIPCFLSALLLALWTARTCVCADETGLRWRGLGRWRSAPWGDVTDYYEQLPPSNKKSSGQPMVIETRGGTTRLRTNWSNVATLQEVVVREAMNARVREWGILGSRPEDDWPRVFPYDVKQQRRTLAAFALCAFLYLGALLGPSLPKVGRWVSEMGWAWGLAPFGLIALLAVGWGTLCWVASYPYREAGAREREQITASPTGLTHEGDSGRVSLAWEEIEEYHVAPLTGKGAFGYKCVVTAGRRSFEFTPVISDSRLLRVIIRRYTGGPEWRLQQDGDVLGGLASRWSGGGEGCGQRVYHYRTRTLRAMLWFLGAFPVLPLFPALLNHLLGLPARSDLVALSPFVSLGGLAWLWCAWRYRVAQVRTDADGIWQRAPFGTRFLAWNDVRECFRSGDEGMVFGNVVGDNVRIRFWLGIGDVEELKEEIARRAVHCGRVSWEKE